MFGMFFAAGLCAFLACTARAQQSSEPSAKLVSIAVKGSQRYTDAQIVPESGLTIGQQVARSDFQPAADKLAELGVFSDVTFRFLSTTGGVALTFTVKDAPTDPVEYDNIPWFTDDELTTALKSAVPLFDGTAPESGSILDRLAAALQAVLPQRGVHAAVDHDVAEDPLSGAKIIDFRIDGDSLQVASVQFGDAAASTDVHVHQSLADIVGKPYSRMTMELFELEQVRPIYLVSGHLRVHFAPPVVRFQGDPNGPVPTSVTVSLPIDLGPVYQWGGVQWSGNTVIDTATLNGIVALKPGDVADGMQIESAWDKIEKAYGHVGRLDAKVAPQETIDDASGRVSYTVSIDEGSLYRMGDLVITGLSLDGENRIRAAFHLSPAQVFDQVYVEQFIDKIQKPTPDVFGDLPVHYNDVGQWIRPNPATHLVDVLLDFR